MSTAKPKRKRGSRAVPAEAKEGVAFLFGLGAKPKADPIFRLIRDHETACAAYEPTRKATANMLPTNPRLPAAEAAEHRASDRELKAALAVLVCQPTTLAGVLAALEHASKPEWLTKVGSRGTGETILSGLHECSEERRMVARQFPLRLAAALREIIGQGPTFPAALASAKSGRRKS
jgi:hypothetical protein